ncbi:MAG: hypothetical protein QM220_10120 [Atribacterota bacterium]|nr:hypothetical protein [Atribacterota bacterium]
MYKEKQIYNEDNSGNNHKRKIEDYIELLENTVHEFKNSGEDESDLMQAGYIGLLNSLNIYDDMEDEVFQKKSKNLIAGEIRNYIRRKYSKVKIPFWLKKINELINQLVVSYNKKYKKFPNYKELSQMLGMTPEGLEETLKARESVYKVSIDKERRTKDITESPDTATIKNALRRKGK